MKDYEGIKTIDVDSAEFSTLLYFHKIGELFDATRKIIEQNPELKKKILEKAKSKQKERG